MPYDTMLAMLNPFPELLVLSFILAPFMLRLALGGLFLYAGWQHLSREKRASAASALRVEWGALGTYFIWVLGIVEVLVGLGLLLGLLTQIAALVGGLIALKLLLFRKRYPVIASGSAQFYILAIAICLSLLISGAGGLAFDVPL